MKRGEIWIAALDPKKGSEIGKQRPVVILQTDLLNDVEHPTCLVLPVSSKLQQENVLRFAFQHSALAKNSFILIDQLRAVDAKLRLKKRIGRLGPLDLQKISTLVKQVLDLP